MVASGINTFYGIKFPGLDAPKSDPVYKEIRLEGGADKTYVCMGVKASNYFMPEKTLSKFGPMGGKWIVMNKYLQVCEQKSNYTGQDVPGKLWAGGRCFAVGDNNYACVMNEDIDPKNCPKDPKTNKPMSPFIMPPIPKIS